MFPTRLAVIFASLLAYALADVEFTTPSAGAVVSGTSLHVEWKDSGISPPTVDIESFSLFLCAGGNNESNYLALANLQPYATFQNGYSWTGDISVGWGANNTNAYFLKMISSVCGGSVINYSSRFTLSSMSGAFPAVPLAAIPGGTQGPDTIKENINPSACTTYFTAPATSSFAVSSNILASATTSTSVTVASSPAAASGTTISLSESALAGIIVGAIVGFLLIAGLMAVVVIGARKRLARRNGESKRPPWNPFRNQKRGLARLASTDAVNELDAHAVCKELSADTRRTGRQEIVGTPISETVGTPVSELSARKSIYEMAG